MTTCGAVTRLIVFAGRAGDRNPLGMLGAIRLGEYLSARTGLPTSRVGASEAPIAADWAVELPAARPGLRVLAEALSHALVSGETPLITMGRCAAGLATLPVISAFYPEAVVVWFDAHADSNVPEHSASGYLGGMVLTGASGLWDSGLGAGLSFDRVILVGSRDLDPFERALIDEGRLTCIVAGPGLPATLRAALRGRRVYVHLDCDVLEPGFLPTEYSVPGGLSLANLREACEVLADHPVLGVEVAELQSRWDDGSAADMAALFEAISPLLGDC